MTEPKPNFVAELFMARNIYEDKRRPFVLVEGETDRTLWRKFATKKCTLFPSNGKDNIVNALTSDNELRGFPGVAGIVDADYWLITGSQELHTRNLVYDSCYPDAEMIMLTSSALIDVLSDSLDACCAQKIGKLANELRENALRLAGEIGYFRLLNHLKDYGLKFKDMDLSEFIDTESLELDCEGFANRLTASKSWISSEKLLNEVAALKEDYPPDNLQLCRGKDVIAIMSLIMPVLYESHFGKALPNSASYLLKEKNLAKELRKAYEYIYFKDTSLFGCIQKWEKTNCPYKILKPEI